LNTLIKEKKTVKKAFNVDCKDIYIYKYVEEEYVIGSRMHRGNDDRTEIYLSKVSFAISEKRTFYGLLK
jgi:hypothetical protein